MMTSKGFWHVKNNETKTVLKIDKQTDHYNRRFFVKPVKFSEKNEYLSHAKKIANSETANFLSENSEIYQEMRENEGKIKENLDAILEEKREKNGEIEKIEKNSEIEKNEKIEEKTEEIENIEEIERKTEEMVSFSFEFAKKFRIKEVLNPVLEEPSFTDDLLLTKEESCFLLTHEPLNPPHSSSSNLFPSQQFFSPHSLEKPSISFEKPSISAINRIQSDPSLMTRQLKFAKNANFPNLKLETNLSLKTSRFSHKSQPFEKLLRNLRFAQKVSEKSAENMDFGDISKISKMSKISQKFTENMDFYDTIKASKKPSQRLFNQYFAEKITIKGSYYGLIELTREDFIFRTLDSERPDEGPTHIKDVIEPLDGDILYDFFPFGSKKANFLPRKLKKQWNLSEILSVQGRSFNLRPCAFELFTSKKASFFNVFSPKIAEKLIKKLANLKKNTKNFFYNRKEAFKSSGILQKWINGDISNFEYLMQLNLYAGRTYNDIHQYPIFPWVLTDYKSLSLDLNNPLIYRDFSLPIGALDGNRLKIYRENYRTLARIPDNNIYTKPFLYGAHYSGLGPVLHYLVRIEPFTTQHTSLQSGSFDCSDRLFSSIPQTWKSCFERDFKELTPEFFYFADFLMNKSGFEFGSGQNGDTVDEVKLPKWANSAWEFVFRNWQALESEFSSRNLHKWIDLVFGNKQTGQNAVDSNNVFGYLTYEENIDLLTIEDLNDRKAVFEQIAEYGQTPHKLLTSEHPVKDNWRFDKGALLRKSIVISCSESLRKNIGNSGEFMQKFRGLCEIIAKNRDCSVVKASFSNNYKDITVFLSNNLVVFIPVEDLGFEGKKQVLSEKMRIFQITGKFSQNEASLSSQFFVLKNMKKASFFIAGLYDGSLKVFLNGKEAKKNEEFMHNKPISCVSCCEECEIVACGSKDCRISLWKYNKEIEIKLFCLIYGHNNEIITIKINEIIDVLISVDRDGVVLLHEIRKGSFIRRIRVELERDEIINMMDIHENGLVLLGSSESRILLYR